VNTPDVDPPTPAGARAAVSSYLDGMRKALNDLPAAEVEEIMEDVGPHVAEVADELGDEDLGRRLAERLGSPEEYAAELRAAAGYPSRVARPESAGTGVAAFALLALATAVVIAFFIGFAGPRVPGLPLVAAGGLALVSLLVLLRLPGGIPRFVELIEPVWLRPTVEARSRGAVGTYARLLQPSWWLARAGIAAVVAVFVFDTRQDAGPLPLLAVFAAFAVGSVWLGRRSQADRRWLWGVLPLNAFALGLGLYLLGQSPFPMVYYYGASAGDSVRTISPPGYENVFVYDRDGKPLTDVYLYDQNGQPITPHYQVESCTPRPANLYPKPAVEYAADGTCREVPARPDNAIPFATPTAPSSPPPTSSPRPTSSPSPTTTGTVTPTR
jgi:hypothetical protein